MARWHTGYVVSATTMDGGSAENAGAIFCQLRAPAANKESGYEPA
jgi:hypothetical protein